MDVVTRKMAEVIQRYDVPADRANAAAQQIMVELAQHFGATRESDGAPVAVVPTPYEKTNGIVAGEASPDEVVRRRLEALGPRPERMEGESEPDYGRRCDQWAAAVQNARKDAGGGGREDAMTKATAVWAHGR